STSRVARDPSVADYRATSPRFAQGGIHDAFLPGEAGEVAPSYGDGGVMGDNIGAAHDPSVADYRATSPRFAQGGI
ncbi:MAG TPA: hypothetical protein VK630_09915, partial [Reyranella sp.]|nr:hypothetical protein [Reyranella sp.]